MYNYSQKAMYLEKVGWGTKFEKTEFYEQLLEKDLGVMSHDEFKEMIRQLSYTNAGTMDTEVSQYQSYRQWCVNQGYCSEAVPLSKKEKRECLQIVNKYLDRRDVIEGIAKLKNPCDKVLLLSIYEGVCKRGDKFVVFYQLPPERLIVNGEKCYISSNDDLLEISRELYDCCLKSAKCYQKGTSRIESWNDEEYVIKSARNETVGGIRNFGTRMRKRVREAKEELGWENIDLFLCWKLNILRETCLKHNMSIGMLTSLSQNAYLYRESLGDLSAQQKMLLLEEYERAFPDDEINLETVQFVPKKKENLVFMAKKRDYVKLVKRHVDIGSMGEEFIVEFETKKISKYSWDEEKKVIWSSKEEGDGLGYDILSYDENGEVMYIEVKTTEYSKDTPFFVTETELRRSIKYSKYFYLYRVYDFDIELKTGKIMVIKGDLSEYCNNPILFEVCFDE